MADLPDLYRRVAAAQGMGLPDAGLTTMPSTSPRFGLDDAFRLGIGSSLLNQGPLASQTAPPVAPDVEPPTSMTGNKLGDVGMALALMGSGLRGDVLPGIAVFQQLDQRRQQRALLEQKRAERDAQLNRQAFDDAFKVASNQGMPWSVRKKMLGQMKDNPVATVFESLGDETIFSDIQSVLKYVDPEMVTQFQKDPRSVPIAKLESELNVAKGLAERDRENVVVERRVSAIDRLLDSNQSIPPADKAFYIEQMKKRDKMDEELRELRAKRRSAEAGARVDEAKTEAILGPEQPIGAQPAPAVIPSAEKGQHDLMLGVNSPEARAVEEKQKNAPRTAIADAQVEFIASKDYSLRNAAKVAAKHPGVTVQDVMKATEDPNKPLIKMPSSGLAPAVSERIEASASAAEGAINTIDSVYRLQDAIKTGNIRLGPGATLLNKADQVAQILGVAGKNTQERLINTRMAIRSLAQFAVSARKQLKGQGQVSDYEGKLIQRAEAGEIDDFTDTDLTAFLGVTERMATRTYDSHSNMLKVLRKTESGSEYVPFFEVGEFPKRPTKTDTKDKFKQLRELDKK